MSANDSPKVVAAPIRMSPDLMKKVAEAVEKTDLKQAEVLRLCLEIGLEDLRACDYAIPKMVAEAAIKKRNQTPLLSLVTDSEPKPHWLDLVGGVAAGEQISSDTPHGPIPVAKEYPSDHYALRVFGHSMEPKIKDHSTIVVRHHGPEKGLPKKGTIVVYSDGNGSTLKEFGYRKATADETPDAFGNVPVLRSLNEKSKDVKPMEGGRIDAVFVGVLP